MYFAALPRELREELWKFVHYEIVVMGGWIANRLARITNDPAVIHRYVGSSDIPVVSSPKYLWLMGRWISETKVQFLYYSRDGMAVYVVYQTDPNVWYRDTAETYYSKRLQDLFGYIYCIEKLIPDHDVWCDILSEYIF